MAVSCVEAVSLVAASHAAKAHADASTGAGGMFVPLAGRILDTRNGTGGYSTPMPASTWRSVAVDGQVGIPSSGVSAVQVTVTAVAPASMGIVHLAPDGVADPPLLSNLVYNIGLTGTVSNTAIVAVGSNGKIQAMAGSDVDLLLDVQGYYTAGQTAGGGYVPVAGARIVDTTTGLGLPKAKLSQGSTTTIQVTGLAGVPAGASAVFVTLTPTNYSPDADGFLTAFPTGDPRPVTSMNFPHNITTAIGAMVDLNSSGQFSVYEGSVIGGWDLRVDVMGYFSATSGTGAFTPAVTRVFDSRSHAQLAAGTTQTVPVAGVKGVPAAGSGISAIAINVQVIASGTASGYLRLWGSDQPEPTTTSMMNFGTGDVRSNLAVVRPGGDGGVIIRNSGTGPVDFVFDVEGWYTTLGAAIPSGQSRTQERITLQGTATGGGDWVTYRYRVGTTANFGDVPVADVTVPGTGTHPSAWPVQRNGSDTFDPYTWDVKDTLTAVLGSPADSLVQVEACFGTSSTDPDPACSMPSNVSFSLHAFGDSYATAPAGPGAVSLLTGDFQISSTDASVASYLGELSIGRTLTTLAPSGESASAAGVFGPSWTADLSGPDAGAASLTVTDESSSGYLLFTDTDGGASVYQATSPVSTYPIAFTGVDDAAGDGSTVTKDSANQISMVDDDGTATTWTRSGTTWVVSGVVQSGSGTTTSYSYDANGLVTRILGAVPAGVSCATPDGTPGCRSLVLNYTTITVGSDNLTRLESVSLSAWDPVASAMSTVETVHYDYDAAGRLADAYDPRITPNLKTAYTYDANGRLATLTPPGLAAYTFGYDTSGRLVTVSRPDPSGPTATTTVVYGVPFTGTGAPVELGAATTATWGQLADLPATGTAVFPPGHVPAGTTPDTVAASDWPYASLSYLDANGRSVNTAAYGAGAWQIQTSQYDANGNVIWALSEGNRVQALNPTSATDPVAAAGATSAERADLLASSTVYNPLNPSQVLHAYGPVHPVALADGSTVHARSHTATVYDEGAPDDGTTYGLPTTSVTSAYTLDGVDHDPQVTRTGYEAVNTGDTTGWVLRMPTSTITQMGAGPSSADLVKVTRYNAAGQTIETRLPGANPTGTDAHTTVTEYYTATGTGSCVDAGLAGLVCRVGPAAQPSSGNPLPTTTYTYDQYSNTLTATETAGATVRTTTDVYDAGERRSSHAVTVTPAGAGGSDLPRVDFGYDPDTGLPVTVSTTIGGTTTTLTTGYDTLGRVTSYTDAAGTTTTTGYDVDGRVTSRDDGKGITTYTYDTAAEHRGLVTSQDVGVGPAPSVFTAVYDPDGNLATQTYPNGLVADTVYDNDGNPVSLSYSKDGSTWLSFTATRDASDRIATQTGPVSSQVYVYDLAGRLITVQDSLTAGCTTRVYGYDTDSNRTSLTSYPPDTGGTCSTNTTPTTTTSSFDEADRLTTTGYVYDTLGRTTTVPAGDAQGIGVNAAVTGDVTVGYYVNDLIATQAQDTATRTYTLDPTQNRVASFTDGTTTTTNHYPDGGDNPTWTQTGTTWTRNIDGIDGGLAATQDNTGTVTLHLANLHGDLVATCPDDTNATTITSYTESTEYGQPRNPAATPDTYSWLGTKQRSTNTLGGLTLMGIRLYNPTTGRFLQTDPVPGGSCNPYDYTCADPINNTDLNGEWCLFGKHRRGRGCRGGSVGKHWRFGVMTAASVVLGGAAQFCGPAVVLCSGLAGGAVSALHYRLYTRNRTRRGYATAFGGGMISGSLLRFSGRYFKAPNKWAKHRQRPWQPRRPTVHSILRTHHAN